MTAYFYEHHLRILGFTEWAKPLWEAIRENAARLAAEAGEDIEVVRKKNVRKLGLWRVRVPTWAPFRLQVYWNGHGWLAGQLRKQEIRFTLVDNAFTDIADFTRAQKIATDIIFENPGDLQSFYEPLLRSLVQVVKPRPPHHGARLPEDVRQTGTHPRKPCA